MYHDRYRRTLLVRLKATLLSWAARSNERGMQVRSRSAMGFGWNTYGLNGGREFDADIEDVEDLDADAIILATTQSAQ